MSVIDVNCGSFCIDKDRWIYFTNDNEGGIYKVQTDGKKLQRISTEPCSTINIDGEWIYYTVNSRQDRMGGYICSLYRIKKDGTEKMLILDDEDNDVLYFNVYNGWIYFVDASSQGNIFRITVDGLAKQRICNFKDCYGLTIVSGKIIFRSYYTYSNDYTYIMDLDGKNKKMFAVLEDK